jgi:hypothetical protein
MLPGMAVHFGEMLQDTPPRLDHMLPAAKRRFFDYLVRSLTAPAWRNGSGAASLPASGTRS